PPASLGRIVFATCSLSARSMTSGTTMAGFGCDAARDSDGDASNSSSAKVRSIPVRAGSDGRAERFAGVALAATILVAITGFGEARRFSKSFCIRLLARSACQSRYRSQSAMTKANRVGAHSRNDEKENAVER